MDGVSGDGSIEVMEPVQMEGAVEMVSGCGGDDAAVEGIGEMEMSGWTWICGDGNGGRGLLWRMVPAAPWR